MYLNKLILTQFKNYRLQEVDWSPQVNALTGLNGMGKTNILEAIYYLCMCKSCRGLTDGRMPTHGERFFRLEGAFTLADEAATVVAKVEVRKSKVFEWNGAAYSKLAEHIGKLPVVAMLPGDIILALEGSEERRRFFDNTFSQLDQQYLQNLILYNRLLQRRNASLKQAQEIGSSLGTLLETYDHQMLKPVQYIHRTRRELSHKMLPLFSGFYHSISQQREQASFNYTSDLNENEWLELMSQRRSKDEILQRTTAGIHRDDWSFTIDDIEVKRYASQGQLKSFVLSLKLAQHELLRSHKKIKPIVLLDDLFDRLDAQRALQLLRLLHEQSFGQIFITDTDESRVKAIVSQFQQSYKSYKVIDGSISEFP